MTDTHIRDLVNAIADALPPLTLDEIYGQERWQIKMNRRTYGLDEHALAEWMAWRDGILAVLYAAGHTNEQVAEWLCDDPAATPPLHDMRLGPHRFR